jgi:hypothetical protein
MRRTGAASFRGAADISWLQVLLRPDLEAPENFTMAKTERLILRD